MHSEDGSPRQEARPAGDAIVYPGVELGPGGVVDAFAILGQPPRGHAAGDLPLRIGAHARIRSHSVLYAGSVLGERFQCGHGALVREACTIGDDCSIGSNSVLEFQVTLGRGVRLHSNVFVPEHSILEDGAWLGPNVVVTNAPYPTSARAKETLEGVRICTRAVIGANSTLLPGITIGSRAIVGAGSVVTRSVPRRRRRRQPRPDPGQSRSPEIQRHRPTRLSRGMTMLATQPSIPLVDLKAQYQSIQPEIDAAIRRVVESANFIQGPEVAAFEEAFAAFCGVPYFRGVSSGTDAIEQALMALGIQAGDEVITTPHTFIATTEAICSVGAVPVFIDIDASTLLMDVTRIEAALTPRTRAIVPVHLYGQMVDMDPLMALARSRGLKVVEDCAQAHGATYRGRRAGSIGDAGAFSFYPGKNLGAFGDAGGVTCRDRAVADRITQARNHGRLTKYTHEFSARNARMDGLQGAVLAVKLVHLEAWTSRRRALAARYRECLAGVQEVRPVGSHGMGEEVYHLFVVRVPKRDAILARLQERGIEAGIHYPVPLHLQPAYSSMQLGAGSFPVCEAAAAEILSLPIYPEMTENDQDFIVKVTP